MDIKQGTKPANEKRPNQGTAIKKIDSNRDRK
jgi:hypothetical protein